MRMSWTILGFAFGLVACKAAPSSNMANQAPAALVQSANDAVREGSSGELLSRVQPGERFYGIYLQGKKVGYGIQREVVGREQGQTFIEFSSSVSFKLAANQPKEALVQERMRFSGQAPYRLLLAEQSMELGESKERMVLTHQDGERYQFQRNDQAPKEVTSKSTLEGHLRLRPSGLAELPVAHHSEDVSFSLDKGADETWKTTLTQWEGEGALRVATFRSEVGNGLALTSKVRVDGLLLSQAMSMGLEMRFESESQAKADISAMDVMSVGVTLPKALGSPFELKELNLTLSFPDAYALPVQAGQTILWEGPIKDGRKNVSLQLKSGRLGEVSEAARQQALSEEPYVDSNHPAIVSQAKALRVEHPEDEAYVAAVVDFVFRSLNKQLATHIPQASEVLARKYGDCTEHTWLTTALLRAGGIVARPVYGLAYTGAARLEFHAWVEYERAGAWYRLEPTWGSTTPGAGYLVLGTSMSDISGVIGDVRFVSLDAR